MIPIVVMVLDYAIIGLGLGLGLGLTPPPPVAVVPVVDESRRKLPGPNFVPSPSFSTGTYFFPLGALPVCHRAYRMIDGFG